FAPENKREISSTSSNACHPRPWIVHFHFGRPCRGCRDEVRHRRGDQQSLSDDAAGSGRTGAAQGSRLFRLFPGSQSSRLDVRGGGKCDRAGAGEAFSAAKGLDPNVQLDADLASEETKATFSSAAGSAAPSEVPPMEQPAEEPVSGAPSSAGIPPGALPPPAG